MTHLPIVQDAINTLKDTLSDVQFWSASIEQEDDEDGSDSYERHMQFECRQERFI